ncbi:MAG: biotin transporter BioY [Neisseriales bacterium]|nr:MAG: biotin transporter BioY [Neisseriales bacterium]
MLIYYGVSKMYNTTLADMLWHVSAKPLVNARCLLLIAVGVFLLTVSSYLMIPLPFSPVPVTMQTAAVSLIGLTYGRRLGAMTVAAWLIAGSFGMPVFSYGARYGIPIFLPTGGYLIGYFLVANLCGYLAEKGWANDFGRLTFALFLSALLIYIPGLAQLSLFVKGDVFMMGCYPFLIGDIAKAALVIALLPPVCRWIQKHQAS